jgi:hypothetical protein
MKLLKKGDIVFIGKGEKVYGKAKNKFLYRNHPYPECFSNNIIIVGEVMKDLKGSDETFIFEEGKFLVENACFLEKTLCDDRDFYYVFLVRLDNPYNENDFICIYQNKEYEETKVED